MNEYDNYNRESRKADIRRWRTQDFVMGYEIKRPHDCDCNCEICKIGDGIYPLDFEWSGWHDGCICFVTPILMDEDEMTKVSGAFLRGEKYVPESKSVIDVPFRLVSKVIKESKNDAFMQQDWVKENLGLIMLSGKRQLAAFECEYQNRLGVFEDCNNLMQSTINFDTFQRRADEALDFIKWTYEQKTAGMPVKINLSESESLEDFNRVFNKHAVRIARAIAETADTPKKSKNAIPKLEVIKSALKESENLHDSDSMLNALIFNLNIDING